MLENLERRGRDRQFERRRPVEGRGEPTELDFDAKLGDIAAKAKARSSRSAFRGRNPALHGLGRRRRPSRVGLRGDGRAGQGPEVGGHVVSSRNGIELDGVEAKFAGADAKADGSIRAGRDRGADISSPSKLRAWRDFVKGCRRLPSGRAGATPAARTRRS